MRGTSEPTRRCHTSLDVYPVTPEDEGRLGGWERGLLAAGGIALVLVGLALWIFPAKHQKPAPESAKCTDAKTCWVEVEDAPEVLLSSFVVLGALFVLVGVNGRRLTKFAGPGVSFESEGAKAAEGAATQVQNSPNIPDDQKGVASTIAAEKARQAAMNASIAKRAALTTTELTEIQRNAVSATIANLL